MEDRGSRARMRFEAIEDRARSVTAVNGHDSSTTAAARVQHMLEDGVLVLTVRFELRPAVEADFANIAGEWHEVVEEAEFDLALVSDLGV